MLVCSQRTNLSPQPSIGKNFERSLIFSKLLLQQKGIYKRTKLMTIPNLDKDEIMGPQGAVADNGSQTLVDGLMEAGVGLFSGLFGYRWAEYRGQ